MEEENITTETLPSSDDVALVDGQGAVSPTEEVVSVKDLLGETLSKNFDSDEAALKAVKDTFSYVGEVGKYKKLVDQVREAKSFGNNEQAMKYIMDNINTPDAPVQPAPQAPAVDESKFITRDQYQADMYFAQHPELKDYRTIIENNQKATGKPLSEVVELPELKTVLDKVRGYDEVERSKSVLMSNPRIGMVTDKMTKAREAQTSGDANSAKENAVSAVLDAYAK